MVSSFYVYTPINNTSIDIHSNDFINIDLNANIGSQIKINVMVYIPDNSSISNPESILTLLIMNDKEYTNYLNQNYNDLNLGIDQRIRLDNEWEESLTFNVLQQSGRHIVLDNIHSIQYNYLDKQVVISMEITPIGFLFIPGIILILMGIFWELRRMMRARLFRN